MILQFLQPCRKGGLGHMADLGRTRKVQRFGQGYKKAKLAQGCHVGSIIDFSNYYKPNNQFILFIKQVYHGRIATPNPKRMP